MRSGLLVKELISLGPADHQNSKQLSSYDSEQVEKPVMPLYALGQAICMRWTSTTYFAPYFGPACRPSTSKSLLRCDVRSFSFLATVLRLPVRLPAEAAAGFDRFAVGFLTSRSHHGE